MEASNVQVGSVITIGADKEFQGYEDIYFFENGERKLYVTGREHSKLVNHILCIPLIQDRREGCDFRNDGFAVCANRMSEQKFSTVTDSVEDIIEGFHSLVEYFSFSFEESEGEFLVNAIKEGQEVAIIMFATSPILVGLYDIVFFKQDGKYAILIERQA